MFSRAAWARILPFLAYMMFVVVADLLTRAGWDGAQLRWLYPVKIAVVLALIVVFFAQYRELFGVRLSATEVALSVAVGLVVWLLWINLHADWMVIGQSAGFDPHVDGQLSWSLIAIRVLGAALVVPIMEELFWRSFLLRWLEDSQFEAVLPAQVTVRSFAITALFFGVEHNLWLAGVIAGAAYAWLYMRTGKIWSAIIAHAVTNGVLGGWIVVTAHWTYW